MTDQIQVEGADQAAAVLAGIGDGLDKLAPPEAAAVLVAEARRRAPRRTGALSSSITGTTVGHEIRVGTAIRYGWPIHSGVPARGIVPRPFLEQAIQAKQSAVTAEYAKDVDRLVAEQAASKGYHA